MLKWIQAAMCRYMLQISVLSIVWYLHNMNYIHFNISFLVYLWFKLMRQCVKSGDGRRDGMGKRSPANVRICRLVVANLVSTSVISADVWWDVLGKQKRYLKDYYSFVNIISSPGMCKHSRLKLWKFPTPLCSWPQVCLQEIEMRWPWLQPIWSREWPYLSWVFTSFL